MRQFLRAPLDDVVAGLGHIFNDARGMKLILLFVAAEVAVWFVYVPIHELLHVLGCWLPGGTITELQLAEKYGAALLQIIFPFIKPGGDYAGRLTGFDHKGSDFIYLLCDAMPFVLSVFIGVPLLKRCAFRARPIVFAAGVVVGLAPFYNITGDYFEMGSVVTTRVVTLCGASGEPVAFGSLRSDDVFRLIGELSDKRVEMGRASGGRLAASIAIIAMSFFLAVVFAFLTYYLGTLFANCIAPRKNADRAAPAGASA